MKPDQLPHPDDPAPREPREEREEQDGAESSLSSSDSESDRDTSGSDPDWWGLRDEEEERPQLPDWQHDQPPEDPEARREWEAERERRFRVELEDFGVDHPIEDDIHRLPELDHLDHPGLLAPPTRELLMALECQMKAMKKMMRVLKLDRDLNFLIPSYNALEAAFENAWRVQNRRENPPRLINDREEGQEDRQGAPQ